MSNTQSDWNFNGLQELENELKTLISRTTEENIMGAIEAGAKEMTEDLLRLPKPKSEISKAGYTHLIDSFSYKKEKKEYTVGWGKYYGLMVENGTSRQKAQHHLRPLFNRNKEKYYRTMISKLF